MGHIVEMKFGSANLSYNLWHQTSIVHTVIRIVLSWLFYAVIEIPYFYISSDMDESHVFKLWALKYFLPIFTGSFLLFAYGRCAFMKLGLVNE